MPTTAANYPSTTAKVEASGDVRKSLLEAHADLEDTVGIPGARVFPKKAFKKAVLDAIKNHPQAYLLSLTK